MMNRRQLWRWVAGSTALAAVSMLGGDAGWNQSGDTWQYEEEGTIQTGWRLLEWEERTDWYYFDGSGALQVGWVYEDGTWYYIDISGRMMTGWHRVENEWYYFLEDGGMSDGNLELNGQTLYFQNGAYQDSYDMPVTFAHSYRSQEQIESAKELLEEAIEYCLAGRTRYEQANRIQRWIVSNIKYSEHGPYDIVGILNSRQTMCQGYSLLYKELARRLGFHAEVITSVRDDHAWNFIMVNGSGYYADTTWSATGDRDYNMMSKERINRDHNPDNPQHK